VPLLNRRALETDAPSILAAATADAPVALLFFDIDHFKKVNDEHGGHAIGDEALISVATVANACVAGKGTVFRYAGDEFIIVLPNHSTDEAIAVGERLRRAVHGTPITSQSLSLSLSIGIAISPDHGQDLATLQHAADQALYDAKELGRNLVRVFGEERPARVNRLPARRQPDASGLSHSQQEAIRRDYFRTGIARCPNDEAMLQVQDTTTFGKTRNSIYVSCPLCGLTEELE
jgi:diguanylate cyclase (GGDEF)-like protein